MHQRDKDRKQPETATLREPVRGGADQSLALRVVGDNLLETFVLPKAGELVIGRAADADIRIDDASISREHARVSIGPSIRIQDLESKNGTWIAGRALLADEASILVPGEVVFLGRTMLMVVCDESMVGHPAMPRAAGESEMERALRLLDRVAPSDISVLIQGETGVGKEVFAERLHAQSKRGTRPLLRLNCGGFPETLLDSELFGYEKGAFTSADKAKPGLLENANGGSVFLDEIGELPLALQARLLRVLQDRKVQRLGGLEPRTIDVRFISATNRRLAEEVARGLFRQDLYYRLNGVTLFIPPLRKRRPEIVTLAQQFLADASRRGLDLSKDALARLKKHGWPGNVRELKNVIERAALLIEEPATEIGVEHIVFDEPEMTAAPDDFVTLHAGVEAFEKEQILQALDAFGGNQTRVAKHLGISRNTLASRIKRFRIKTTRE
jgi:two-component system, NtrC family, response regulator AtoC